MSSGREVVASSFLFEGSVEKGVEQGKESSRTHAFEILPAQLCVSCDMYL